MGAAHRLGRWRAWLAHTVEAAPASTILWYLAILLVASSLTADALRLGYLHLRYDMSEVVRIDKLEVRSVSLRPGEPFGYRLAEFYKRADCTPPDGKGELTYYLHDFNVARLPNGVPARYRLDYERESRTQAGQTHLDDFSEIPLPVLAPGSYAAQWRAVYTCANSPEPVTVWGPVLRFSVAE